MKKKVEFFIEIRANKEKVWNTLWRDETFRQWSSIIDPGTYMVGDLKEDNEIQFISSENSYGITSIVEKVVPGEFLLLKHKSDTKESGKEKRDEQWTGSKESYTLTEKNGVTTLAVVFDVPLEFEEYFNENYPKALRKVKELSEDNI